jgi:hypothetical protein
MRDSREKNLRIGYDWSAEVPRPPNLEMFTPGSRDVYGYMLASPSPQFPSLAAFAMSV